MYTSVKATAISIKPRKWDKAHNADMVEEFVREAVKQDSPDLIVTTEGVLEGYVVGDVVRDTSLADAMVEIAEPLDGPYIKRFRNLASALHTCFCFGFAERAGDEVFNTAIFVDGEGEIRGRHRKVQFAEGSHESWNFNRPGTRLRAFDTPFGRAGILICNDRWNPAIARTLVLDGAQMLLIPSYGMKTRVQNENVLARARENGVPIVEANVGVNMIVSKGEIVAYAWGNDQITTAIIEVPAIPSANAARRYERKYLEMQSAELDTRYQETQKELKGEPSLSARARVGELIAGQ
jgi:predicted amidohydrolase